MDCFTTMRGLPNDTSSTRTENPPSTGVATSFMA